MKKNTAAQKWIVFAFDETNNTPKAGDAAQITAKISRDGAAGGAVTDTNPTELEGGYYVFDIDAADSNGDYLAIIPVSSTGNVQVVGCPAAMWTSFPQTVDNTTKLTAIEADTNELQTNQGAWATATGFATPTNITAGTITTISGNVDGSVGSLTGHTVQTGDSYAIVNGVTGLVAINTDVEAILLDTGTTIPATITTAQADLNTITGVSGVLIDTDAVDADALKADAITEIWAAAMSDLVQGAPSATASVLTAINYLYEAWRNKTETTATKITLYRDDGAEELATSVISDDATTFTKAEFISGV